MTTNVLNLKIREVENKIPGTSSLVTATVLHTKIGEVENKISDYAKYIATPKFNKSTTENVTTRLKQPNLVSKTGFDNELTTFNRKIASNKTKYWEALKKLNSVITSDYNFFLGRIYFTSNGGSQNTFIYSPTLDYVLSWKSKGVFNSKLKPSCTGFLHSIKLSGYKMGIKFDKDPLVVEQNKAFWCRPSKIFPNKFLLFFPKKTHSEKIYYIFLKEIFLYISVNEALNFLAQTWKNKNIHPEKNSLYFTK